MAHTKSAGSTRNGRDSHSKRLGSKLSDGQFALAGSIIYRQRGTKIFPGKNAGMGGDNTIFCLIDGYVKFEQRRNRKYASVYKERIVTTKKAKAATTKKAKAATAKKATVVKKAKAATTKKVTVVKKATTKKVTTTKKAN